MAAFEKVLFQELRSQLGFRKELFADKFLGLFDSLFLLLFIYNSCKCVCQEQAVFPPVSLTMICLILVIFSRT